MSKKRGEISDKLILKEALKKKVRHMLKRPNLEPEEAYNLIKDFFKVFTGHDYEYTREELVAEIRKVYLAEEEKKHLENIVMKLGMIEFYLVDFTKDELKEMLNDFVNSIEKLIHAEEQQSSNFWDGFATKLTSKLKKEDEKKKKKKKEETLLQKFLEEAEEVEPETPQQQEGQQLQGKETIPESEFQETIAVEEQPEENIIPKPQTASQVTPEAIQSQQQESTVTKDNNSQPAQDESHFHETLESFYFNLDHGSIDLARLEYEELSYHYERLTEQEKKLWFEKVKKAHADLVAKTY